MNANPKVVVEQAVPTTVARARLVVVAVLEPARSTARTRMRSQVVARARTPLVGEKLPGEGTSDILKILVHRQLCGNELKILIRHHLMWLHKKNLVGI